MADMNLTLSRKIKRGTNILEIAVPAALERSIPLAKVNHRVAFMNHVFGGEGATPSSVTLFTGVPGSGKSTVMFQVADAITEQGHICLFNGNEEAMVQVRKTCKRLGLCHGFTIGNDVMVEDMHNHVASLCAQAKGMKAKDGSPVQVFYICDSLQTMDDGKYTSGHTNTMTPLRVAEEVTEFCKQPHSGIYPIAILIGHVTKAGEFAGKQGIKHVIDAHMHLRIDVDSKSDTYGMRLIGMSKNRFGCAAAELVLTMDSRGLCENGAF